MNHPVAFIIGSALFGVILPSLIAALSPTGAEFDKRFNVTCCVVFGLLAYGISP